MDDAPIAETDVALYGKSPKERIVAVHPVPGNARQQAARMRVYYRDADDAVSSSDEAVYPFFFLSDIQLLSTFTRNRYQYQELAGQNFYKFLAVFKSWNAYWDAIRHIEKEKKEQRASNELYLVSNPVQQYFMQTGQTCFKGMKFDELHRMQLDIEVYSEGGFPHAHRAGDEIIIVALSDNRGWHQILHSQGLF